MWEKIAGIVLRNRLIFVSVLILVTGFMAYKASQVQLTYDNPKFIPLDDPDYIAYENFKALFGEDGSVMVVGINTPKITQLDFFKDWYKLTKDLASKEGVKRVLSIANVKNLRRETTMSYFEGDSFESVSLKGYELFAESPQSQASLDSLFKNLKNLKFYEGLLFKDSNNFSLIAITLEKKILDTKDRIAFIESLENDINTICQKHEVETHFSGLPYIRTVLSKRIQSELVKFTLMSIFITALILWFFFRSFPTLFFSLLVVIFGVIWCMAIVVLLGFKISMFIGLLPPLIVVIGIANCIYLLNKYHDEYRTHKNKIKALQRVIAKVGLAVFLTNLTTSVGFGVFVLTGSTVLQEFGLVAFLSIMALYLISIVLIPVLFSLLPPPKKKHIKHLDYIFFNKLVGKISQLAFNKRKLIYVAASVVVLVSLIGISKLKNIGYMVDDIPKTDKLYIDLKFFEKNINGVLPFEILIDTKKPQGVDQSIITKIDLLERKLADFEDFSTPISISKTLKFLNQAYYGGDVRRYTPPAVIDLASIMNAIPRNTQGGNNQMIRSLIDSTNQKARVSVQVADVGSVKIKEIREKVAQIADTIFNFSASYNTVFTDSIVDISEEDSLSDTTFYAIRTVDYVPMDSTNHVDISITGTSIIFLKGNDYLISNLLMSLLIAFIIISLIMASIFKSGKMILISVIPNIIPLLFTAGVMGFAGVSFKPSTILVFSVAFGIAVDFSIHFLSKYKMELARTGDIIAAVKSVQKEVSTSMIYTAIILFFGFIIFVFSNFGGTVSLGLYTAITLLISLLSNLLILPSLLLSYDISKNK